MSGGPQGVKTVFIDSGPGIKVERIISLEINDMKAFVSSIAGENKLLGFCH
jgi:hypothetical protein